MVSKKLSFAQNATFNTVGILINNVCLWLTTLMVVRLSSDYTNAGIWQLSISVTNIFFAISQFNLVPFMVTDVNNENTSEDYAGAQLIASVFSFVLCVIYALCCGYSGIQFVCIVVYMLVRVLESISAFLFGVEQIHYRMDYVGISSALRGILDLIAFSLVLMLTSSIVFAIVSMVVVSLAMLLLFDVRKSMKLEPLKIAFSISKDKDILQKCLPSVLSLTMIVALSTVPRQFLDYLYGNAMIGYYATVAAPIVVVQVIIINIFTPLLREVAIQYNESNYSKIYSIALKLVAFLVVIYIIASSGAFFVGKYAYSALYGPAIVDYFYLVYALIGCAVMYSVCWVCWNMLIIMRKSNVMVVSSTLALLITIVFSKLFITEFGLNGVSFIVIVAYTTFIIISLIYITYELRKQKRVA